MALSPSAARRRRLTRSSSSATAASSAGAGACMASCDVEAGILQANRDLGGLEDHPVTPLGVAKVEPNHGSARRELLAIDVAGDPDDQQVGIELLGARLGERPGRAP